MNGLIRNMWVDFCKEYSLDNVFRMIETWSEMFQHHADLISYAPSASPRFDGVQGTPTPGKDRQLDLLCRFWKDLEIYHYVNSALQKMPNTDQKKFVETFRYGLPGTQTLELIQQELIVLLTSNLSDYPYAKTILKDYKSRRDEVIQRLDHNWKAIRKAIPEMVTKHKSFFGSCFTTEEVSILLSTSDWQRKRNTSLLILYLEGEISRSELTKVLKNVRGGKKLLNRIKGERL